MSQILDPEDYLFDPEMPSLVEIIGCPDEFGEHIQRRDRMHDCGSYNKIWLLNLVESMDYLTQRLAGLEIDEEYVDYYGYGLNGGGGGHSDVDKCPSKTNFSDNDDEDLLRHRKLGHTEAVRNVLEPDRQQSMAVQHAVLTTTVNKVESNQEMEIHHRPITDQEDLVEVKVEPTELRPWPRPRPFPQFAPRRNPSDIASTQSPPSDDGDPNIAFDVNKSPPVLCDPDDGDLDDNGDEESREAGDIHKLPKSLQVPSGTPEVAPREVRVPTSPRKFACPYLKFDPKTYGQRPRCRGPSFPSAHRLKEHLYRIHGQKPNCDRCRKIFSTEEDVRKHRRSKDACGLAEGVVIEGFDASQKEKLQSKKRTRSKSEEDKWNDIFRILFPDCTEVPDPFYNPYFDSGVMDPASGRGDVERIFTDSLKNQICDEIEKAIGARLSRKKRRDVTDAVMKALRQGQTTVEDGSRKATAEVTGDGRERSLSRELECGVDLAGADPICSDNRFRGSFVRQTVFARC